VITNDDWQMVVKMVVEDWSRRPHEGLVPLPNSSGAATRRDANLDFPRSTVAGKRRLAMSGQRH